MHTISLKKNPRNINPSPIYHLFGAKTQLNVSKVLRNWSKTVLKLNKIFFSYLLWQTDNSCKFVVKF